MVPSTNCAVDEGKLDCNRLTLHDTIRSIAGSAMVTAWCTPAKLKNLPEFFLVDDPGHPGKSLQRVSGQRFRDDPSGCFDPVRSLKLGDLASGYAPIDLA